MRRGSGARGNRLNYPLFAAIRYSAASGKRLREVAAFLASISLRAASRPSCAALGIAAKLVAGNRRYLWRFHGGNASFQVLLGMDVISTGSLVVQGNSTFSFSF